jgi:alpha-ketoglutarate-dependent taurine dioxygenase
MKPVSSYRPIPPKLSILRAVTLPGLGGDTVWANTVAAYDGLPDTLKALAEKLRAVHGNDFDYAASRVELLHDDISKKYRRQYAAQASNGKLRSELSDA